MIGKMVIELESFPVRLRRELGILVFIFAVGLAIRLGGKTIFREQRAECQA